MLISNINIDINVLNSLLFATISKNPHHIMSTLFRTNFNFIIIILFDICSLYLNRNCWMLASEVIPARLSLICLEPKLLHNHRNYVNYK